MILVGWLASSSSSPAKAGDPVTTRLSVITGCPACAGHDKADIASEADGVHARQRNLIITLYCWRVVAHCKYSESGPSHDKNSLTRLTYSPSHRPVYIRGSV